MISSTDVSLADLKQLGANVTGGDATAAGKLTLSTGLPRRVVKGEAQGDKSSDLQNDKGDILQCFPYQL